MQREPCDARVIRSAGYDPATGTRAGEFRNQRIYRFLEGPPAEWMALEDAESAGADFSAHLRHAYACWGLGNLARATHHPAAPL